MKRYNEIESELFRNSMMSWSLLAGFRGNFVSDSVIRFNSSSFSPKSAYNTLFVPPDMDAMINDRLNQMQNRIRVLNGDRAVQNDIHSIQGTFNRNLALENDYLHFFAPGDGIFDSIVNNAVSAYKGRCSAFAIESEINWEGFVFDWHIVPDESFLLRNGISWKQVNQYRSFISSKIISTYISTDGTVIEKNQSVIKEFRKYFGVPTDQLKECLANFGKRTPSDDFLRIKQKYDISNLSWFRENNSVAEWTDRVTACYNAAKKQVLKDFRKLCHMEKMADTLDREYCSVCASNAYFGRDDIDPVEKKRINEIILKAFTGANVVLDSVCYVRMINI